MIILILEMFGFLNDELKQTLQICSEISLLR